jgi:transcriptional regulator with XRE-family HTH domain
LNQGDRIKELRKKIELTQKEFAQEIGIKNTAISKIENGDASLTEQNIKLICSDSRFIPGVTVSETWLRTGEGEMFVPIADEDSQEAELLDVYRQLWDENKDSVRKHARFLLHEQEETGEKKPPRRGDTSKKTI